jgi:ketosteroid isomerase-like protein
MAVTMSLFTAIMKEAEAMSGDDAIDLVDRYNLAWFAKDIPTVATFLGDDLVLWHNHLGRRFNKTEMLEFITAALEVIAVVEFRNARRLRTSAGVVQQHEIHIELKDGGVLTGIPQCIVYTVSDGKIRAIEEYTDGLALAQVSTKL